MGTKLPLNEDPSGASDSGVESELYNPIDNYINNEDVKVNRCSGLAILDHLVYLVQQWSLLEVGF